MTSTVTVTAREHDQKVFDAYVEWVDRLCREPGTRAALRRGLRRTPDQAVTMHRYVARWTESLKDPADEWAYYTVAALMADRPSATRRLVSANLRSGNEPVAEAAAAGPDPGGGKGPETAVRRSNLGATLAALGGDADRADPAERRLHLLVRQQIPGIQRHLPGLIRYLAAAHVAPDWGLLLRDLTRWRSSRAQVCREWLQSYYRARSHEHPQQLPESDNDSGE